jgi:hypothetical protein
MIQKAKQNVKPKTTSKWVESVKGTIEKAVKPVFKKKSTIIGPEEQYLSIYKEPTDDISFEEKYKGYLKNKDKLSPITKLKAAINLIGYGMKRYATKYVPETVEKSFEKYPEASEKEKRIALGLVGVVSTPVGLIGGGVEKLTKEGATTAELIRGGIDSAFGSLMLIPSGAAFAAGINAIFAQPEVADFWEKNIQPKLDNVKEEVNKVPIVKNSPALQEVTDSMVDILPWIVAHKTMSLPFKTSKNVKIEVSPGNIKEYKVPVDREWWGKMKEEFYKDVDTFMQDPVGFLKQKQIGGSIKFEGEVPKKVEKEKVREIESQILAELEVAQKGERIFTEEGVTGIKSTFPEWVPQDLRDKKLFDSIIEKINTGNADKIKDVKEKQLLTALRDELLKRSGIKGKIETKIIPEILVPKEGEAVNMLANRILESKIQPEEIKKMIKTDPLSFHKIITDKETRSIVDKMTEQELYTTLLEDQGKISTFAGRKLLDKLESEGRTKEAFDVVQTLEAISTKGGQILQAQREMAEWLTPTQKVYKISKDLQSEKKRLTEKQKTELIDLFKEGDVLKGKVEEAAEKARGTLNESDFKKYEDLAKKYDRHILKEEAQKSALKSKRLLDIASYTMRGNMLTPVSLARNVLYNIFLLPFDVVKRNMAAMSDLIISKTLGKIHTALSKKIPEDSWILNIIPKEERTILFSQPRAFFEGTKKGLTKSIENFVFGGSPGEYIKTEVREQYKPLRALASAFTGKDLLVSKKTGKPLIYDRVKKLIEGIVGIPPTILFRALGFGDIPIYMGEKVALLTEFGKLRGLKGKELEAFVRIPNKEFLDILEAKGEVGAATFQQQNLLGKYFNRFIKWIGGGEYLPGKKLIEFKSAIGSVAEFLLRSQVPWVKTTVNVVGTTIKYVIPQISVLEGLWKAAQRDRRGALMAFSRAVIGFKLNAAAKSVVDMGCYNSTIYEKKKTSISYSGIPMGYMNITGFSRGIVGEDPSYRPGDVVVDMRTSGLWGAALELKSYEKDFPEKEKGFMTTLEKGVEESKEIIAKTIRTVEYAIENMFLGDIADFFMVIKAMDTPQGESKFDTWLNGTFESVLGVAVPNTISIFSKGMETNVKETKDDITARNFSNIIKNRTFQTEELVDKIGLYGEPIERTPKGRSFLWYILGPIKWHTIETDLPYNELHKLYQQTQNESIIPSYPEKTFKYKGEDIQIDTPEELHNLYVEVGSARRKLIEDVTTSAFYDKLDSSIKIELWKDLNEKGREIGIANYMGDEPPLVTTINMYRGAYSEPNLTQAQLGERLATLGVKVNADGTARREDYKKYKRIVYELHGATLEDIEKVNKIIKYVNSFDLKRNEIKETILRLGEKAGLTKKQMWYLKSQTIFD